MPELLVMRHAKSDWDADGEDDHERPLASRGIKAARLMGRFLADANRIPVLAVCSTAVRARRTLELAAETDHWTTEVRLDPRLYLTDADTVLSVLGELGNAAPDRVMVVGHEPWCSQLVAVTTGGTRIRFPTAAVALIRFDDVSWAEIGAGSGELKWLVTPKLLGEIL
jgi:phosphohistidine phosphatase